MRNLLMALSALAMTATGAAAAAATSTAAGPNHAAFAGSELLPMATVKLDAARATALKAHPGTITDQELEKEAGGSGLRYSFDIARNGKAYEVGVDARTGKVLENKAEGRHPD